MPGPFVPVPSEKSNQIHLVKVLIPIMIRSVLLALVAVSAVVNQVNGHGRLMDPPSRSSLWRLPEFKQKGAKPNYNDNELNCGGFQNQHGEQGGKCGVCGDPYQNQRPRDNENGGKYGAGIISREYRQGQNIKVHIDLSASHKGYFEFRICKLSNAGELEQPECFDRNLLTLAQGGTKFPVPGASGDYYPVVQLSAGLTCDYCVFQWHYKAGNNWGTCADGSGAVGCGPQETFMGCADITIKP